MIFFFKLILVFCTLEKAFPLYQSCVVFDSVQSLYTGMGRYIDLMVILMLILKVREGNSWL